MTHKYKLGNYVKYYTAFCKHFDKIEYMDLRKGFINSVEEYLRVDGGVNLRYTIGTYLGSGGYVVCEEAIVRKLKAPKYKSKLDYLKVQLKNNACQIKTLNDKNMAIQEEIAELEREVCNERKRT